MQHNSRHWAILAARTADDKLGRATVLIDVSRAVGITDYFVITNGGNYRQVEAIVEAIEKEISEAGGPKPYRIEGKEERSWVLMDYIDFLVHVFDPEAREYYELERLWKDEPQVEWQEDARGELGE